MSVSNLEINHIYQGDSTQKLKELASNSIQLVITSPPYYAYKNYGKYPGNIENFESYEKYIEYFDEWFKELFRVTDDDGRVCIIVDDKHTNLKTEGENRNRGTHARFIMLAEKHGFCYKDLIIWQKIGHIGHPSGGAKYMLGSFPHPPNIPFLNCFEYILVFRKRGKSRASRVTEQQKQKSLLTEKEFYWAAESIWKITSAKSQKHPCPYPEEIPRRLIKLFSFHGETVLDPFVGSGTTARVCKQLGRNFIAFDLNPIFCDLSKDGLKQECLIG